MRVAKRYIAKVEKTIYTVDTIEIIAEREGDALEMLRQGQGKTCLLYTSPSPRDLYPSRMPS